MRNTPKDTDLSADRLPERALWQRCRLADAPVDEERHFIELAAFAEGGLDADDRERIAALLAGDSDAAADVAAVRALAGSAGEDAPQIERIVARATALRPRDRPRRGLVVALSGRRQPLLLRGLAQWGSLAAAVAMAAWLGFAMGSDASLALNRPAALNGEDATVIELFDPATGFLHDTSPGAQT